MCFYQKLNEWYWVNVILHSVNTRLLIHLFSFFIFRDAIRLISVICWMFKIFRTLIQNYCTDAGLGWRLIKKENIVWRQMFGFWSTNIADSLQISTDFTRAKGQEANISSLIWFALLTSIQIRENLHLLHLYL